MPVKKTRSRSAPQHWSHGSRPNWWSIYLIPVMCVCVSGGWLPDPTGVLQLATQPAHILHIRSTTQVIIFKNLRLRALFNTFEQCCGAEPFFLGSGSRYFFWLRLQVKKNCSGSTYKSTAPTGSSSKKQILIQSI